MTGHGNETRELAPAQELKSLDELAVLTGLESLTLDPCTRLSSLAGIERFVRLEHLVLRECGKITDQGRRELFNRARVAICAGGLDQIRERPHQNSKGSSFLIHLYQVRQP